MFPALSQVQNHLTLAPAERTFAIQREMAAEDVNGDGVKVTAEDVELFVKALDADGDNMIGQTEFIDYMLRGMAMTPDERSKFARRSQMHAKLNRFVENILWRLDAEEL